MAPSIFVSIYGNFIAAPTIAVADTFRPLAYNKKFAELQETNKSEEKNEVESIEANSKDVIAGLCGQFQVLENSMFCRQLIIGSVISSYVGKFQVQCRQLCMQLLSFLGFQWE